MSKNFVKNKFFTYYDFSKKNKTNQLEQIVNQHNNDPNCTQRFITTAPGQWTQQSKN